MEDAHIRARVSAVILDRFAGCAERREEALRDVLGLTVPGLDAATAAQAAARVPELPAGLYEKWTTLFADRLLETVSRPDLLDLCRETPESEAALALVFVMFMESERMEKTVAEDLRAVGALPGGPEEAALGAWLRARMQTTH